MTEGRGNDGLGRGNDGLGSGNDGWGLAPGYGVEPFFEC